MANTAQNFTQRLLSIKDLRSAFPEGSDEFIQHLFNITQDLFFVANSGDDVTDQVEDNTNRLDALEPRVTQNEIDILQNAADILQNSIDIQNNTDNIAANTLAIIQNALDIATNEQSILNLESRVLGAARPPSYQESGASYAAGDYVVNPASDPQNYFFAIEAIADPAGPFDSSKWAEVSLKTLAKAVVDDLVYAAYGSIGLNAATPIANFSPGVWVDLPFDVAILSSPKDVAYNLPGNSVIINREGIWSSSVKVSLTFVDVNAGRQLRLRFFNVTTGIPSVTEFVEGVGRNSDAGGFSFVVPLEALSTNVGDEFKLQVSADSAFTGVTCIGSIWYIAHNSEAKFI